MEILKIYEEGSCQKVNKNKTTIFFSKSTPEDTKVEIKEAYKRLYIMINTLGCHL